MEGVVGDCLLYPRMKKDFLDKTQKYTNHKGEKTDKFDYIKKWEFYSSKAIINWKSKSHSGRKYFMHMKLRAQTM